MGSNGTVDERLAEAEAARAVLGAAWRVNLRCPTAPSAASPITCAPSPALDPRRAPARGRDPVLVRPPSRSRRRQPGADRSGVQRGLRRYDADGERVAARVGLLLLHQRLGAAVVRRRRQRRTTRPSGGAGCHASQFTPAADGAVPTRLTSPRFSQLIESRDAQFGALAGVRVRRRHRGQASRSCGRRPASGLDVNADLRIR